MIQFNLLPDVKVDYIKARRQKRNVMMIALLSAGISFGLMLLLFTVVNVAQKTHLNNLSEDIAKYSKELEDTPDLDKVLTVQNQLNSLTTLHDKKPVTSRLTSYLTQVTPNDVSIGEIAADMANTTLTIKGTTDNLKLINQFVDTLKFTDYQASETTAKAFSSIVLASFGRGEDGANYEITLKYDPAIFSSASDVKLIVPSTTTTRSVTETPNPLFEPLQTTEEGVEEE